jgi:MoaA/NifB/PqqE/SkfB family radical SAM enzyme
MGWEVAHRYPPDRLTLHLTNLCNANCIFCGYQFQKDSHGFLSDRHFQLAVDQYADMGGKIVDFTPLVGDALVDKNVFRRLTYAVEKNSFEKIFFYTNGILLGRKEYPERLLSTGISQITFSVPGFDKELYKRVYRNSSYNYMLKGINKFLILNAEAGYPVKVYFALKPDVRDSEGVFTEDYYQYIHPYIGDDSLRFVRNLDNWGGSITNELLTGDMKLAQPIPVAEKKIPCYYTFFLTILVDGSVRLCGCRFNNGTQKDQLVIGHLDDKSLVDLWSGEQATRVRQGFVDSSLAPVCIDCAHYGPYSGKEKVEFELVGSE